MVINLENEKWVDILGYEEFYQLSNFGRIKALYREWYSGLNNCIFKKKDECIISERDAKGYRAVILTKNGIPKSFTVHRLLAIHFIKNPENKPQVNHINGIKTDNRIENLEWCTESENQQHAIKMGLKVHEKRQFHSQARKVKCDTFDLVFGCIRDAGDALGIDYTTIWHICRGDRVESKGLTFRYI